MAASVKKLARLLTAAATSACASGALAAQPATVSTPAPEAPSTTVEPATPPPAEASADSQSADANTKDTSNTEWVFITTPYIWASGSKSEFTTRQGEKLTSKDSFFDLLGDLKFALMGASEARHGRLVLLGDLMFVKLSDSAQGHFGPIPLSADADLRTLLVTGLVGYRAIDRGPMSLDLLAGGRLTGLKANLEITGPLETHEADFKKTHIAPVLGSRLRVPLGQKWGASIYGDVGGFGISSALSWQAMSTVQYDLSKHWQLGGGWRHYYGRATDNGFKLVQKLDGPIFTVSYRM